LFAFFLTPPVALVADTGSARTTNTRRFQFTYQTTITGLKPGQNARIWLPVAPTNEEQTARIVSRRLPAEGKIGREPVYGNEILFVEAPADADGKIPLQVVYKVTRKEVNGDKEGKTADDKELLQRFLEPDRLVPIAGKPLELLKDKKLPKDQTDLARLLYDLVNHHMKYSKQGEGWGRGDAVWACDSRFGNCSDFHSLFISLARSQKIPAKFEMGFPLPLQPGSGTVGGYHCWAKFRPQGQGWIPVDISEANKDPKKADYYFGHLSPNRIAFSVGRDLNLVPRQDGPPLNFFIYPYVEVGGKPYPREKISNQFSYEDER
jgi:transglutaminase-like putative cysteine protease